MRLPCFRQSVSAGVLTLTTSVLLFACGGGSEIVVTQAGSGSTIEAARGDVLVRRLPENPTTGSSWKMALSGGLGLQGDHYIPDKKADDLVGVGGTHEWRIDLDEAGTSTIKGVYRQEWDPRQSPQYFTLTVDVR